ncbi:snoRNP complex protein NOP56 [Sporobolomyces koalae]|uniref:snoRNP complex protein NOP56 n=1 Tax=Sporobolomyces koalae TaxID=500713 RepID=UPI0031814CB9
MATHLLFECATGLALFSSEFAEEIGKNVKTAQDSIDDVAKFGKLVKLVSFVPFQDAAHALEVANDVSEGVVHEFLHGLLELNLAKKPGVVLGVEERGLASSIKATLNIDCDASDRALELLRGIRLHQEKLLAGLEDGDTKRSQLGLGHAYSRAKVKFNVNRSDNMIIQAIALLDQLDKDVNTFAMRVREWYGWHFPELVRIVPDNYQYAKVIHLLGDKSQLTEEILEPLTELLGDNDVLARNILDASRASMGTDISPVDHINIKNFATRVIHLYDYRKSLQKYLSDKMGVVAPNLASLIGDTVGARLISHAGSLTNLSKYPASTVQILGAEKALFRALKTKGNTPKYGLIYHSTFIGRAGTKNKGRISRFLANKCSIASRIDCFADTPSTKFGEVLRNQVEERLSFYESGSNPTKNADAMKKALDAYKAEVAEANEGAAPVEAKMDLDEEADEKKEKKDKKKKRKSLAADETAAEDTPKKKSKKEKKAEETEDAPVDEAEKKRLKAEKKAKKEAKKAKASA